MVIIFEVDFYQKENGRIPVKEFLSFFGKKTVTSKVGEDVTKKSMKTPRKEIARAVRYMKDYKSRQ